MTAGFRSERRGGRSLPAAAKPTCLDASEELPLLSQELFVALPACRPALQRFCPQLSVQTRMGVKGG